MFHLYLGRELLNTFSRVLRLVFYIKSNFLVIRLSVHSLSVKAELTVFDL